MSRKIITINVRPPIPVRDCDWMARFDGDEEGGPRGFGETEEAAVSDLTDNFPDDSEEAA